nr:hypothetical protein [Mycoplasmopsis bovis]
MAISTLNMPSFTTTYTKNLKKIQIKISLHYKIHLSLKDDLLSLFENKAKSEKANVASFKKDLSNFATALESSIMNDAIVAKANSYINDIKKSDSTIDSEMKKIKESENSSQLGNELNSFKNNINNAYKKESEAFISNFKQNIIVEQYKVLYRELKTAKNDDENEFYRQ